MNTDSIKKLYFKDTTFANLMRHRIYNVLLFASKYDAFVLEEDGRIDEQLFNEYTSLNPVSYTHLDVYKRQQYRSARPPATQSGCQYRRFY